MKNKSFKVLFGLFLLAFVADLVTTLIQGKEMIKLLEANILFKYGGLPLIILINIILMAGYYYWYHKTKSVSMRFMICFALVAIITTRLIVCYNNYQTFLHPPTIEQAMAVTTAMKQATMQRYVWLNVLPFFNGMFAWLFFKYDHIITRRGDEEND